MLKINFIFLCIAFFFSIFPGVFVSFNILAIVFFLTLILIYVKLKDIKIYKKDFFIISFFVYIIIQSLFLKNINSFLASFAILFYIFILLFFRNFPFDEKKIKTLVKLTSLSLTLFSTFALIHYFLIKESIIISLFGKKICEIKASLENTTGSPLQSILFHPTGGGVLIAILSSFLLIWLITHWDKENVKNRIFFLLSILIPYATIILTSSRSGFLAVFISIIVSIILSKKYKLFFIFLIFGLLFLLIPNDKIKETISKPFYSPNIEPRLLQNKLGIEFFKKNPLFGIGLMQFKEKYKNSRKDFPELPHYFFEDVEYLHNTYTALLTETGILGFLLFYIYLFLVLIEKIKSNFIEKNKDFQNSFALFMILWFLLDSLFNAHIYVVPIGIFLWIGIGLSENDI